MKRTLIQTAWHWAYINCEQDIG